MQEWHKLAKAIDRGWALGHDWQLQSGLISALFLHCMRSYPVFTTFFLTEG